RSQCQRGSSACGGLCQVDTVGSHAPKAAGRGRAEPQPDLSGFQAKILSAYRWAQGVGTKRSVIGVVGVEFGKELKRDAAHLIGKVRHKRKDRKKLVAIPKVEI